MCNRPSPLENTRDKSCWTLEVNKLTKKVLLHPDHKDRKRKKKQHNQFAKKVKWKAQMHIVATNEP